MERVPQKSPSCGIKEGGGGGGKRREGPRQKQNNSKAGRSWSSANPVYLFPPVLGEQAAGENWTSVLCLWGPWPGFLVYLLSLVDEGLVSPDRPSQEPRFPLWAPLPSPTADPSFCPPARIPFWASWKFLSSPSSQVI